MSEEPTAVIDTKQQTFSRSAEIGKLAMALSKAQGAIEGAKKDSANPFFHSKYADLSSVWEACRQPLAVNELAVVQLPGSNGHGLFVDTILTHSSGEWICGRLLVKPGYTNKEGDFVSLSDPQAMGSAITYARRYALQAIVGIAPEDDDGNAAAGTGAIERRQEQRENAARSVGAEQPRVDQGQIEIKPFTGNWRDVTIHFGKHKGKKLGELEPKSLGWFKKWQPEPFKGRMNEADLFLKSAVNSIDAPENQSQDEIPMFNGPKHEALAKYLEEKWISEEDFMAAAKFAKLIPENAKAFRLMSEQTATSFMDDPEVVERIVKSWKESAV